MTGCRDYYWAKDLSAEYRQDNPWYHWIYTPSRVLPTDVIISVVDVDYYLDLEPKLARFPAVYCFYTFELEQVSSSEGDLVWTFDAQGDLLCMTAGGGGGEGPRATYKHKLHNFNSDTIIAASGWFPDGTMPCYPKLTVYSVIKKKIDVTGAASRCLVVLVPQASYTWPWTRQAEAIQGQRIQHLNPVQGDFLRLEIMKPDGIMVSTSRVGSHCSITLPKTLDDALVSIDALIPKTSASTVKSLADYPKGECAVLAHYIRAHTDKVLPPIVYAPGDSIRRIQYHDYDSEAECNMNAFGGCLIDGAYAFDESKGNVAQAIHGRLLKYRMRDPPKPLTNFKLQLVDEFASQALHRWTALGNTKLVPLTVEEMCDVITKSNQKAQFAELLGMGDTWSDEREFQESVGEMMLKRETYGKVTDPRCITMLSHRVKFVCLSFAYPLMSLLKAAFPGMCSGRSSADVSEKVVGMCIRALIGALEADLERMDGTYTQVPREATEACTLRWFDQKYHVELAEMEHEQYNLLIRTLFNLFYETEFALGSGSGETTPRNNISTGLMYYIAYRTWKKEGVFMAPEAAMDRLDNQTVWSGDDSGAADLDLKQLQLAAACLGFIVKGKMVRRGDTGYQFLARDYTAEVFSGCPDSCASLSRQLPKFFCCTGRNIDPSQMAVLKALSYYITDGNTPVLGELSKKILDLAGGQFDSTQYTISLTLPKAAVQANVSYSLHAAIDEDIDGKIVVTIDPERQYPNAASDEYFHHFGVGGDLESFDTDLFRTWLDSVQGIPELLATVPVCFHPNTVWSGAPIHLDGYPIGNDSLSAPSLEWTTQGPSLKRHYRNLASERVKLAHTAPESDLGKSIRKEMPKRTPVEDGAGGESAGVATKPRDAKDKCDKPKPPTNREPTAKGKGGKGGKGAGKPPRPPTLLPGKDQLKTDVGPDRGPVGIHGGKGAGDRVRSESPGARTSKTRRGRSRTKLWDPATGHKRVKNGEKT